MSKKKLQEYLSNFVTERRNEIIEKIVNDRTRYITVALENIYQSHNASAVIRSCDCFGIQDMHIIENCNEYQVNPDVALGAQKWLTQYQYNSNENTSLDTINRLKQNGYRIVATTPHTNDVDLHSFDVSKGKFALFFGTEQDGLSSTVMNNADEYLKIPMYGFTESFNISVSAAICLHHLTLKLRSENIDWQLTEEEKLDLSVEWLRQSIKKVDMIEEEFYKNNKE